MAIIPFLAAIGSVSSSVTPDSQPLAEANFPDFIDPNVPSSRPYNGEEPQAFRITKPVTDETVPAPVTGTNWEKIEECFESRDQGLQLGADLILPLSQWHSSTREFFLKLKNVGNIEEFIALDAKIQKLSTALLEQDAKIKKTCTPIKERWVNAETYENQVEPQKYEQQSLEGTSV
jgi:hypothetical protein